MPSILIPLISLKGIVKISEKELELIKADLSVEYLRFQTPEILSKV
jgi:hypothetical protein